MVCQGDPHLPGSADQRPTSFILLVAMTRIFEKIEKMQ